MAVVTRDWNIYPMFEIDVIFHTLSRFDCETKCCTILVSSEATLQLVKSHQAPQYVTTTLTLTLDIFAKQLKLLKLK